MSCWACHSDPAAAGEDCFSCSSRKSRFLVAPLLGMTGRLDDFRRRAAEYAHRRQSTGFGICGAARLGLRWLDAALWFPLYALLTLRSRRPSFRLTLSSLPPHLAPGIGY